MIRVLLDTNIVLDVLLDRQPWSNQASKVWHAHLANQIAAHITATTITDVFYVARRHAGREQAKRAIHACLDQLYIIAVGAAELQSAATLGGPDFEDCLQISCAMAANLDVIVTRDPHGFVSSEVDAIEPEKLLNQLAPGS
jgi:predicted nucleic acid-binding protein